MKELGQRLKSTVSEVIDLLLALDNGHVSIRPAKDKWSKKEILGHLIDSATNNHRRFVKAQYQDDLIFDGYVQDKWVEIQAYQNAEWKRLVMFWSAYNLHLAEIIDAIPETIGLKMHTHHNFNKIAFRTVPSDQSSNLAYFIADYIDHLEHHIRQILD